MSLRPCSIPGLLVLALACTAQPARALKPDQILLVINGNVPIAMDMAQYYARQRHIPPGRVVSLDLPVTDDISFADYQHAVVAPLRAFLRKGGLTQKITCLVTFYGVPLRVQARPDDPQDAQEVVQIAAETMANDTRTRQRVDALELLAAKYDTAFKPDKTPAFPSLDRRVRAALNSLTRTVARVPPGADRDALIDQVNSFTEDLIGRAGAMEQRVANADLNPPPSASDRQRIHDMRLRLDDIHRQIDAMTDDVDSREHRAKLRDLIRDNFGPFDYDGLLRAQQAYLKPLSRESSVAAVDSELSLLWWTYYPRSGWLANPLYRGRPAAPEAPPALMTMRLDAPQPVTVRNMIDAGIEVQARGLQGQVVIDTTGKTAVGPGGGSDPMVRFDQSLRDLATLVRTKTNLPLLLEDTPALLPPHAGKDVALYCGWYSVRNYVPCCDFVPGAVGYHVASFELMSLRNAGERGWCRGLLNDGIAATLGTVAEPYLQAFPDPAEFFPLLMCGRFTLAEVYWRTTPMTSWMVAMIGDPLYNPYERHPALKVQDLPESLKVLLHPPSTAPATP